MTSIPLSEHYQRQVALLIAAMPFVAAETDFALKGGTAINLFVRDMPRLSVDIDLTYLPVAGRPESLAAIDAAMRRMRNETGPALTSLRHSSIVRGIRANLPIRLVAVD